MSVLRPRAVALVACLGAAGSLLFAVPGGAAPESGDTLYPGERLDAGQAITTADGDVTFVMQSDGNAVEYRNATGAVAFATNTAGNAGAFITLQNDGNLVVYSASGTPLWYNGASGTDSYLRVQSDANLVEYYPAGYLWSSQGGLAPAGRTPVGGSILYSGQTMKPGEALTNSQYVFVLQGDGNLVEYAAGGRVVGDTETDGVADPSFVMQTDGNAVFYGDNGTVPYFSTDTAGHPGAVLVLQTDGNVVVYDNGVPLFATGADS